MVIAEVAAAVVTIVAVDIVVAAVEVVKIDSYKYTKINDLTQ